MELDLTEDLASVAAGPSESQFVIAPFANRKSSAIAGGVVEKFTPRGKLASDFGRGGILRFPASQTPTELHELSDGSMILTSALIRRKKLRYWVLTRLRRHGETVRSFGTRGAIKLRIPDPGNRWSPRVMPLDHGRFGVVGLDYNPDFPRNRLYVFDRDGSPDRDFGESGHKDFNFDIDSATPSSDGDILVAGSDSAIHIVRIDRHGVLDRTWGDGGVASSDDLPINRWAPDFDPEYMRAEDFGIGEVQTAIARGRLAVTFRTFLDYVDGLYDYGWAVRFDAKGRLDDKWGVRGRRNLGSSYNSSESDEGDNSAIEMTPLRDGRIFYGEYFDGSWSTFNDYKLRVTGASGRPGSAGSRALRLHGFWEIAHALQPDGRFYFALGERRGRVVATRIRL
jgi:hypothetical protein